MAYRVISQSSFEFRLPAGCQALQVLMWSPWPSSCWGLSAQLINAGRHAEAVAPAQAAVDVLRGFEPPADAQAAHLALFAEALHTLALRLIAAGRTDEAVEPAAEAVQVYRRAAAASGADVTAIAGQLLALSAQLSSAGRPAEAAAAAQAANEILEHL